MTICTRWRADDACELSMTKYYCMDFALTKGDPDLFRKIVEEGRKAGCLEAGVCVQLEGPKIEDLQKEVPFDATWLNTREVFERISQDSQCDKKELEYETRQAIQDKLNEALRNERQRHPKDIYRECYFVPINDSFRLRSHKFASFYNAAGFKKGSKDTLMKIAHKVAEVAEVLKQEVESGSFEKYVTNRM